jgi:hypothetical protein
MVLVGWADIMVIEGGSIKHGRNLSNHEKSVGTISQEFLSSLFKRKNNPNSSRDRDKQCPNR